MGYHSKLKYTHGLKSSSTISTISSASSSNSSSSSGIPSCSSSPILDDDEDDEAEDDDISGLRLAGADSCGRIATPPGGTLLRILSLRLASISSAPLNLGINGMRIGPGGTFSGASVAVELEPVELDAVVIGTLESEDASLSVISISGMRLGMSAFRGEADAGILGVASGSIGGSASALIGRGWDIDRLIASFDELDKDWRFPFTRNPSAPDLDGPSMVVVYLRPVAPNDGRPPCLRDPDSSSLGAGLLGMASSGHRSTSASPASTTYGFERYDGSSEIKRCP